MQNTFILFVYLPQPLSLSIPAQNIIEEDAAAAPSPQQLWEKTKKAKYPLPPLHPPFHTSCLTFVQAVPKSSGITVGYIPPSTFV